MEVGEYEKLYKKLTGKIYKSKEQKRKSRKSKDFSITLKIAPASEIAKMVPDKSEIPIGNGDAITILCDYSGRITKGDNRYFYCDKKAVTEEWWKGQGRDFCKEHAEMVKGKINE